MDGDGDDRKLATGIGSRRRAALVVAAAASLTAVAVAGWWATHPSAFEDGGGLKVVTPASVGKAVFFHPWDLAPPPGRPLRGQARRLWHRSGRRHSWHL